MPTIITHAFVGASLTVLRQRSISPVKFGLVAAVLAMFPDIDVLGMSHGIAYSDWLGHRGFTHSFTFAALLALLVSTVLFREVIPLSRSFWLLTFLLFLATASHGILDSLTNAGLGVGFLIPFDDTRYFAPWRPLTASPLSISRFLGGPGAAILVNEIRLIWLPVAAMVLVATMVRRVFARARR